MMAGNQIDQAVAATEQQVTMVQVEIPLPSGRPMLLALPADVTDLEALQGIGAYLVAIDRIRAQRPKHGIVVPAGVTIK